MLFNSFHFLLFFPIVLLIYQIIPDRVKYLWLLAASYYHLMFLYDDDYRVMFDVREDSLLEGEKVKRLVENLGERVEAWSADEWDEVDWGAEALDSEALDPEALDPEQADDADLVIAVYSKHDGEVVDVRSFKDLSVVP